MGKTPTPKTSDDKPPATTAATSPASFQDQHGQHSFLLQAIMEVQKAVGALGADITTLKGLVTEQGRKLDTLHGQVSFARGVFWVIVALLTMGGRCSSP